MKELCSNVSSVGTTSLDVGTSVTDGSLMTVRVVSGGGFSFGRLDMTVLYFRPL